MEPIARSSSRHLTILFLFPGNAAAPNRVVVLERLLYGLFPLSQDGLQRRGRGGCIFILCLLSRRLREDAPSRDAGSQQRDETDGP